MKVLFLDVDGVLNCAAYFNTRETPRDLRPKEIDPMRVLLLHRILEATGTYVVVSSSWRLGKDSLAEVERAVSPHTVLGVTPRFDRHEDRHAEISEWLVWHPETTRYAILDDDACAGEGHGENFFKTEWYGGGLTDKIAVDVMIHLGLKDPKFPPECHGKLMKKLDEHSWKCVDESCPLILSIG